MKQIKVLAITNVYPTVKHPGETPCIKDQVDALGDNGVAVDLLIIDRYHKINYLLVALKILLYSLGRAKYSLIHAYYGHCGLIARLQWRTPIIVTYRGSDILGRDGIIGKWVAKRVDGVIVMSEEMKLKSAIQDAEIIPFGVNQKLFKLIPMDEARNRLGLNPHKHYILFPWNPLRPEKRFDIIKEALDLLLVEYPDTEVITIFDKSHDQIALYMSACNVMVLASNYEGSPMAIREAVSCRLPVVSVDVGDVGQILKNINGSYIVERSPGAFAEKITQVFENDKLLDSTNSNLVSADFAAKQVLDLYKKVLNINE